MTNALLQAERLTKFHNTPGGRIRAVDDVSLELHSGEVLGLVGESGCGKSTLGRTLIRLHDPDSGRILFENQDITALTRAEMRSVRRNMQIIFQDPYASLNPRRTVRQILSEPYAVHSLGSRADRQRWANELLVRMGLRVEHGDRHPHEFSGGQRQRISIARAIALKPKLIVCDEPVSALDVSIQAQIINLLKRLQNEYELAYLFISHDLSVVGHIADRIAVMYLGEIVEIGDKREMWRTPLHPYTQVLLSAVPVPKPPSRQRAHRITLKGEPPSAIAPPPGCRFWTRCPSAMPICREVPPSLRTVGAGRAVACHLIADR